MSECWMFNAVPTARVIFTAKTSLSLRREQVWTFSVLGDRIYEMRTLHSDYLMSEVIEYNPHHLSTKLKLRVPQ